MSRKSLKDLAKLAVKGFLPLPQFYAACAERLVDTERAERLLIDTRAESDAQRQAIAESAARMAGEILAAKRERTMTAGKWVVAGNK